MQASLLHRINEKKLAYASVNQARCASRFLCGRVLGRPALAVEVPLAKVPTRLPRVLTRDAVSRLLAAAGDRRTRTVLLTTSAAGLRVAAVCARQLRASESAPERMGLKVRLAKGGKDRYPRLSPRLLDSWRRYWRTGQPRPWLFANAAGDGPMGEKTAQRRYRAAGDRAGLTGTGGSHSLRHAFATPRRESGVDSHPIQRLRGHGPVATTRRYCPLAPARLTGTAAPLALLDPWPR